VFEEWVAMKAESASIQSAKRTLIGLIVLFVVFCGAGSFLEVIQNHFYFGWLVLPFFWIYWLILLFSSRGGNRAFLFKSWALIDVSILIFFYLADIVVPNWLHSNGSELAVFLVYAPVVFIVGFVLVFVPIFLGPVDSIEQISGVFGDIFSSWFSLSFMAALQCLLLYWIAIKTRNKFYFTD
jgi:hypothetical protein